MPSLSLNSQKKQISHIANLHCSIYEKKEIISKTSLTTKDKSDIIALKTLMAPISSFQSKSEIRSILEKKIQKNNHPKIKYLMPESCLVQPFVELGVKKLGLEEFFGLP